MLLLIEKENNETARQYASRILRYNIQYLYLKPGQLISEIEIAEQLGLSRTPIREAFKDLERSDIVYVEPQRGTFVSPIDIDLVKDSCFLRLTLEKAVVELSCNGIAEEYIQQLDENLFMSAFCISRGDTKKWFEQDHLFHKIIFRACGKERLYDFIDDMMIHFNRVRLKNLEEVNMTKAHNEHLELFDVIKRKDAEKAVALITQHLTFCVSSEDFTGDLYGTT